VSTLGTELQIFLKKGVYSVRSDWSGSEWSARQGEDTAKAKERAIKAKGTVIKRAFAAPLQIQKKHLPHHCPCSSIL
jgi:hypothetical protein